MKSKSGSTLLKHPATQHHHIVNVKKMQWVQGQLQKEGSRKKHGEEDPIVMEDIPDDINIQEDQQARSVKIANQHPGGSSSGGGANQDNNNLMMAEPHDDRKSQYSAQLVNYEDMSRKSNKKNTNSTKNLKKIKGLNINDHSERQSVDDLQSRKYMVFAHKQSSENFSVTHSVVDVESDHYKTHINKINRGGARNQKVV